MKVTYKNKTQQEVIVIVEPWSFDFKLPPSSSFIMWLLGIYKEELCIEQDDPTCIIMHVYSAPVKIAIDGKDCTPVSMSDKGDGS